MYTFSSRLKTFSLILMVLGAVGIGIGFYQAPKDIAQVEKPQTLGPAMTAAQSQTIPTKSPSDLISAVPANILRAINISIPRVFAICSG